MLAMSSTSSSTNLGGSSSWPSSLLEDPLITLLPNYHTTHLQPTSTSTLFPPPPPSFMDVTANMELEQQLKGSSTSSGGTTTIKKLNHNASERHRRKKINNLYSSLRNLLPHSDHHPMKKLSIPTTVSKVLKYIPTLQQQVDTLIQKKKELLSTIPNNYKQDFDDEDEESTVGKSNISQQIKSFSQSSSSLMSSSSSSTVSTSWISEQEVMVQVSTDGRDNNNNNNKIFPVSEILLHLQHSGLTLINSSSFQSFQGRVFYNFHLQVEGSHGVEAMYSEALSERLLRLYEQASYELLSLA
ncbi:Transcription factor ORG2 [Linum perenne]